MPVFHHKQSELANALLMITMVGHCEPQLKLNKQQTLDPSFIKAQFIQHDAVLQLTNKHCKGPVIISYGYVRPLPLTYCETAQRRGVLIWYITSSV
eukprot:jgi/Chrzof1/12506/Cz06g36220.t1